MDKSPSAETWPHEVRIADEDKQDSQSEAVVDPDVIRIAQVAGIIVLSISALAAISIQILRAVTRAQRGSDVSSPPNDNRLEQLQQSVDGIAIEVERIAESQRFTARLLAERAEPPTLQR